MWGRDLACPQSVQKRITLSSGRICAMSLLSILDRGHTVAKPGFSRWMVPPAALCIHLCIGQAYAFSVFNLPMTKLLGISASTPADWKLTDLGWIFSIAIFFLGARPRCAAAGWKTAGRARAMFTSGLCWAGGFFISAIGVYSHHALAGVSRLRRHRRHRPRARLHLAGVDADQVVPRPAAAWRPAWRSWASAAAP